MIQKIEKALSYQLTINEWRNSFEDERYLFCSNLNYALFGKSFNQKTGCHCVDDLFILLPNQLKKAKIMEKSFFKLKEGQEFQNPKYGFVTQFSSDAVHYDLLKQFGGLKDSYDVADFDGYEKSLAKAKVAKEEAKAKVTPKEVVTKEVASKKTESHPDIIVKDDEKVKDVKVKS